MARPFLIDPCKFGTSKVDRIDIQYQEQWDRYAICVCGFKDEESASITKPINDPKDLSRLLRKIADCIENDEVIELKA